MNTFWLKIAAGAIGIVVIIILIGVFTSNSTQQPEPPEKSFYDQAREDKQKFLAEPQAQDDQKQEPVSAQDQAAQNKQAAESKTAAEPVRPTPKPVEPPKSMTLYFKPLSEIEKVDAERMLNMAVPGRSIGRLPMTGFKLMVDNCRGIISKYPDSWYAYRAKQMLADMPPRYQKRYKVTEEELDFSRFAKPRPGAKPFTVEESR